MVDWKAPSEIALDSEVYGKLVFALFGLYVWELFQTSGFEWSLITRTRKLTWPLVIFFFQCRYCLLLALVGIIVSMSVRTPINCQALYTFNSWAGNMAILGASTSLMLRTIAIWDRQLKIVIPLCFLCLCHWVLLWRGMFLLNAQYDPTQGACVLLSSNHIFLNVTFFMTMGFDLTILTFTIAALVKHKARSGLWSLLFTDGLVYFLTAFCFNALPAIPAATLSAIAACRAVIRLQEFTRPDVYVHSASQIASGGTQHNARAARRFTSRRGDVAFARPEVHVTTDQFVVEDYGCVRQRLPVVCGDEGGLMSNVVQDEAALAHRR
ncbi:uncharacterized protein B0H18DRAFT_967113 [Fomitopsis serialis]|uniref:uncharacterized protein n=1 Tax=Fomitopsis serialis TaxID=139415 RepID=UPI002008D38C|nr:uncharacterized protein B0H18DRAFT_967113 [Neoantrodia serialis]KAH9938427.1 hypothetical protein B0H18DRAFT_967113 [Neoantrodia serialis]